MVDKSPELAKQVLFPKPEKFRPAGSPAGTWHHTPWWVCVFHDEYERVNFWSHFLPGLVFIAISFLAYNGFMLGAMPMVIFCTCATITHMLSALTHVWPDDHFLEKIDHLGIVALIAGTPFTAMMAQNPNVSCWLMLAATGGLIGAAFLKPLLRTITFVSMATFIVFAHGEIINVTLAGEGALYITGACMFIRNGGHDRWTGFTDHHFLHYFVTAACALHVYYIIAATAAQEPQ